MTQIAKLYAWIIENPRASISFGDFERLLKAFGSALVRTKGSHRQYSHRSVPRIFSVQPRGKQAKSYRIEQFVAMIEEHGLNLDA